MLPKLYKNSSDYNLYLRMSTDVLLPFRNDFRLPLEVVEELNML